MVAFAAAAVFSVPAVWLPQLTQLSGFARVIGAALDGLLHWPAMRRSVVRASADDR